MVALSAPRGGAKVQGVDLTPELVPRAKENAALMKLEGEAESPAAQLGSLAPNETGPTPSMSAVPRGYRRSSATIRGWPTSLTIASGRAAVAVTKHSRAAIGLQSLRTTTLLGFARPW